MKKHLNKNIKVALVIATITTALTGCGSSTEEEQFTWITQWNNNYDEKIKMLNACFKEAGVKSATKSMSKNQKKIMNECEFVYMTDKADDDGVSLDRKVLVANVFQL